MLHCIHLQIPQSEALTVTDPSKKVCELQSAQLLHPSYCRIKVDMENTTSTYEWEYYYDYIDPVVVDESQLKYNKCKYLFFYTTKLLIIIRNSNSI